MKNQYFGDVNDFRKYGLLRALQQTSDLQVGVCWCLTADDGGGDGERRTYLRQPGRWRHYDSDLFDRLQRLLKPDTPRSVSLAADWSLIRRTTFFDALLPDGASARADYFARARRALASCDLVFLDPDNGIEVPSARPSAAGSSKYVYWSELKSIYAGGQSLLVYQHFPRVTRERFIPPLITRLGQQLPGSTVTAFSTAHVVFFLVQQAKHARVLAKATQTVQQQWRDQIEVWPAVTTGRRAKTRPTPTTNINEGQAIAPDSAWEKPATNWGEAIDRYTAFLQVPTWRASVKRDGFDRTPSVSREQAALLGQRMRSVLRRLRGANVIDSAPDRRDLTHLWSLQGRQIARSERCPSVLQVHFQRAFLLNAGGYTCAYCGRTAWGVYSEDTGRPDRRTLRFEVDHRITRRRLRDPQKFDPENLVAACRSCNAIKAEMSEASFRCELASLATAVSRQRETTKNEGA